MRDDLKTMLFMAGGVAVGYFAMRAARKGQWWLANLLLGGLVLFMLSLLAWGIYGVLTE